MEVSLSLKCFPSTLHRKDLKTQLSPVTLDLCLRKTRSGKSRDYCDATVFEKLRFQNVSLLTKTKSQRFSNSPRLKSVFEKFRFSDGLVWTVHLTVEIKLHFQISPA